MPCEKYYLAFTEINFEMFGSDRCLSEKDAERSLYKANDQAFVSYII